MMRISIDENFDRRRESGAESGDAHKHYAGEDDRSAADLVGQRADE
jgi:hypothetical protein